MNKNNYEKAYTEVLEILKYLPQESVNKLSQELLNMFEIKRDKNYIFKVDENKSFDEQKLLPETKAIFANIFRDYWATPTQKEKILLEEFYEKQQLEKEKREKYNPDNIFKTTIAPINNIPTQVKKEKLHHRFINFIKNIFSSKKSF